MDLEGHDGGVAGIAVVEIAVILALEIPIAEAVEGRGQAEIDAVRGRPVAVGRGGKPRVGGGLRLEGRADPVKRSTALPV
jgi:hypothetical protein